MATVLIVEDETVVLVLSESVIQHAGYETMTAATLSEALALIETDAKINVVATDIALGA